jgi:hypothetical protein
MSRFALGDSQLRQRLVVVPAAKGRVPKCSVSALEAGATAGPGGHALEVVDTLATAARATAERAGV